MDKITESIRKYLDSAGIPHQTIFNGENGQDMEYPTSTAFYRANVDNPQQRMLVVVNIYPTRDEFRITSFPIEAFGDFDLDKLRAFEAKWNRGSGLVRTGLVINEGIRYNSTPNVYCFQLNLFGFCDSNGLEKMIWRKYLERVENDTWDAWEKINEILGIDDEETDELDEPGDSDIVPF